MLARDVLGAAAAGALEPSPSDERALAALVESVRRDATRRDELVAALREDSPFHAQKSRVATARMRAWVLASFEHVGLDDAAIPFVIEELESGHEPYIVAAAARAVRGRRPADARFARYLVGALENVRGRDQRVTFSSYGAYAKLGEGRTATTEILTTLRWMGRAASDARASLAALASGSSLGRDERAELDACLDAIPIDVTESNDCCALPLHSDAAPSDAPNVLVRNVPLNDHRGATATFQEIFVGRPSIVVFFYTRCDNPRKCSLTVSKLAAVQRMLRDEGLLDAVATAAITYDPGFDHVGRLAQYGIARGFVDHPQHRLLRAVTNGDAIVRHFRLGVGFIASLVNRHRTECFVLDGTGRVQRSFSRTQWDAREVVAAAKALVPRAAGREDRRGGWQMAFAVAASIMTAFFPKCPVCWAAYLSAFGMASLARIPFSPWLFGVCALLLVANLASLFARARRSHAYAGFALSAIGSALLLVRYVWLESMHTPWIGVAFITMGSLLGVRGTLFQRIRATPRRAS